MMDAAAGEEAESRFSDESMSMTSTNEESFFENKSFDDRTVFQQARQYIRTGWPFRFTTSLYSERKLLVTFMIHFICTMVIWGHFALIKFQEQEQKVPEGANRYWWKRIAPPLEFGSMHAILFQAALLPLTMSRLSIAVASSSVFDRFVPFNRMMRLHIHLGYTMISIVFLATVFFFAFFGLLCSDGEEAFCAKFTSEIMITGYCLVGLLLIVGVTSFLRYKMVYEVFYCVHHLVFIVYALGIAHTLDVVQRTDEKERSQTFKWYSVPLLYYICDRASMYLNQRYKTSIVASSAITSSKGTRMAIIKVHRPLLFHFKPGQYCLLRIPAIDRWWHPFSIASGPNSDALEFYIEVHDEPSWTNKLWGVVDSTRRKRGRAHNSRCKIAVEVKGPYGTSLGETDNYSHAIAIGSGTGIVPILSLLKQHIHCLRQLDGRAYFEGRSKWNRKVELVYALRMEKSGTIGSRLLCPKRGDAAYHKPSRSEARNESSPSRRRESSKSAASANALSSSRSPEHLEERRRSVQDIVRKSRKARLPIYGSVALLFLPALGFTMIGLTLSWNTIPIELYPGMDTALKVGTILFQAMFTIVAVFVHESSEFLTYIDIVMAVISGFADWYWFDKQLWGEFDGGSLVYYSLLTFYMTMRVWYTAVKARSRSWRNEVSKGGVANMDKLTFVWVTRSASLVSKIVPDITRIWDALCESWGEEAACKVCSISVYVTDKDRKACDALKAEVGDSSLYKSGAFKFERPDMQELIENHTLDRINDDRSVPTNTLLAFCGSPSLASCIQQAKIANDISAVITGHGQHQMEFVSESYGTSKSGKTATYAQDVDMDEVDDDGNGNQKMALTKRFSHIYKPLREKGNFSYDDEAHANLLYSYEEGLTSFYEVIQVDSHDN